MQGTEKEESYIVGDIVIVKSDLTTRNFWKSAKVEQLLPGGDD